MDVALVLRHRLKELGVEQRDLATAAQVTESYISQLVNGKKTPPAPSRTDIYERMEGVAVWIPSDNYPVTFWRLMRSVPLSVIFGFGRVGGGGMKYPGEYMDTVHKRLAPLRHWFLQTIGVARRFQGNGYADKLLRPMFSRIDAEGLPCYLETLDETNVPLYERFGFRVVEKSTIPETILTNWAMLKEVQ
jgi:ribosomal protein S18 acetylase RimI-like enzyme